MQSSDEEISVIPFVHPVQLTLAAAIANLKGRKLRYNEFDVNEAKIKNCARLACCCASATSLMAIVVIQNSKVDLLLCLYPMETLKKKKKSP